MDSSLFQWAGIPASTSINALTNPKIIYSQEIIEDSNANMWECSVSKIKFHGRHFPHELLDKSGNRDEKKIQLERSDTVGRIRYLCKKFINVAKSKDTKLYILGLHPDFFDIPAEEHTNFLKEFYAGLQSISKNASLLVIAKEELKTKELLALDNGSMFFIRFVRQFAPSMDATNTTYMDLEGYNNIFQEFSPNKSFTRKKSYKFNKKRRAAAFPYKFKLYYHKICLYFSSFFNKL